jgi:hypothetical protein
MEYLLDIESTNTTVIYVSFGCLASNTENYYKTSDTYSRNHEYPLFLRKMRQKYGKFNLHMFLIDPMLEKIPYVCENVPESGLKYSWETHDDIKFINKEENIIVYGLREYGYHRGSEFLHSDQDKINNRFVVFIDKLNELSIKNSWTTFIFTHTGEYFSHAPKTFYKKLGQHNNHIIYGYFIQDNESSCGIDTSIKECDFITKMENKKITVFNPYYHYDSFNETLMKDLDKMSREERDYALQQFNTVVFKQKKKYIEAILSCLRTIYKCKEKNENLPNHQYDFITKLQFEYEILDINIVNEILFDQVLEILKHCLHEYLYLYYFEDTDIFIENTISKMLNNNVEQWKISNLPEIMV